MDYEANLFLKWSQICRTCLCEECNLLSFCETNSKFQVELTEMVNYCTNLQIAANDSFPQKICLECVNLLKSAFSFKKLCEKSDATLRQIFLKHNLLTSGYEVDDALKQLDIKPEPAEVYVADKTNDYGTDPVDIVNKLEYSDDDINNDKYSSESDDETPKTRTLRSKIVKTKSVKAKKTLARKKKTVKKYNNGSDIRIQEKSKSKVRRRLLCEECGKTFETPKKLHEHKNSFSHLQNVVGQHIKICRRCRIQFADEDEYHAHIKSHEKKILCTECGKGFANKYCLKSHMVSHTKKKEHLCTDCGKFFSLPENLTAHKRIHTGEKRYTCEHCGEKFIHWNSMKSHVRTYHTKEKKHVCHICAKAFSQPNNLAWHVRGHTGEKPYPCQICDKRFKSTGCLKKHIVTHTGERNFPCPVCNKAFSTKSTVTVHMRIHTGERNHVCQVCGRAFTQAHVLRGHMRTHPERVQPSQTEMQTQTDSGAIENRGCKIAIVSSS